MLYLLNKNARTVRWNGEPLHEATSAIVKEALNGEFTLSVKYPISDTGIYQQIKEDMLIKCPTPILGPQLFRIKKPVENNDYLEITAYHITDDIMQRSIKPVSVDNQSCGMALSRMVQNAKTDLGEFSFNSDIQDRRTFNTTETTSLYSILLDGKHSIVGAWEGELVRDNFSLTVKKSRGENHGVVITTHKNLKSYQRSKNSQNIITRIHAKSTYKPEGSEDETTIKVTVDSPLINSYPYINEKEYENNNAKTVEELKKWAQAKFTNEGIDKVSDAIKIEAYELDGQIVNLGDTVNIKSLKHDADLNKKSIAYEYDALKEEYISLTFDDKAEVGSSKSFGGLSNAAETILNATQSAQEIALDKALKNADLDFEYQSNKLKQEIQDGIELAKAKAEENKQALSDEINRRFHDFSPAGFEEAKAKAEEALKKAGATADLAEEAKRIADENSVIFAGLADKVNKQDDKLADYKQDIDGRFTTLTSQIVGKVTQGGPNMLRNSRADDGLKYWNGDPSKFQFREHEFYLNGQKRIFLLGSGAVVGSPRFIFKKNTDYMLNLTAFDTNTARVKISLRKRRKNSSADFDESQVIFEKTSSPAFSSNEAVKRSFSFNTGDFDNGYLVFEYTGNPQGWSGMFMTELDFYEGSNDRKWQPSPEDSEEPIETVTQKLAEYKETVDGRFATISSQVADKVDRVDFQRVKETSQLYERILGSNDSNVASNIARMALTSELFEVEVGKRFSNLTNLFYAPTKIPKYISSVATDTHLSRVGWSDHHGIRINYTDSMSGWLGVRFPLTKKFVKQGESLGYRIEIAVDKVPRDGKVLIQLLDNTSNLNMYYDFPIPITKTGNQVFTGYLDIPSTGELNEYSLRFTLTSPGNIIIHKPMIVDKRIIPNEFIDSTDYNNEYNRVTMSLMKDSFAIKSLNSAGDIIAGINVGANGNNRIVGKATHITGETLIDNAVIKSAMIDKLKTANFEAGSVTTTILGAGAVTADKVLMDTAMANKFVASDVFTNTLAAKTAFINKLRSVVVSATLLEGYKGKIGGFQIGTHDKDPNVYWLTGQNQFAVGMSNGSSAWGQAALWVNWGTDWGKSGPYAWFVLRTGEMYCKNDASFYKKVDFANESSVNFYGNINYYKEPKFFNGLNMWDSEIIGGGSNPKGGNNAVVWWNQIGSGSVKYWIDKSSDRRLKENITQTAVNALDRIDNLDMVEFDFIKDKKHEEIGLIAQEVERIIPQAISRNPDNPDDYLHIDYTALVPYLIKAIQELNKKVERLGTT